MRKRNGGEDRIGTRSTRLLEGTSSKGEHGEKKKESHEVREMIQLENYYSERLGGTKRHLVSFRSQGARTSRGKLKKGEEGEGGGGRAGNRI